jgi:hypothetical protein
MRNTNINISVRLDVAKAILAIGFVLALLVYGPGVALGLVAHLLQAL